MHDDTKSPERYAANLATQMRKGFLAYCVLLVCAEEPRYVGDILRQLDSAELVAVEGTLYPLLSRLQKDALLSYEWRESDQGPSRKYYQTTAFGAEVVKVMRRRIADLMKTLTILEKKGATR